MRIYREYAVYKGDELLAIGTAREIAKQLNVKEATVYFWSRPVNIRRNETRTANRKVAFALKEDDLDV